MFISSKLIISTSLWSKFESSFNCFFSIIFFISQYNVHTICLIVSLQKSKLALLWDLFKQGACFELNINKFYNCQPQRRQLWLKFQYPGKLPRLKSSAMKHLLQKFFILILVFFCFLVCCRWPQIYIHILTVDNFPSNYNWIGASQFCIVLINATRLLGLP